MRNLWITLIIAMVMTTSAHADSGLSEAERLKGEFEATARITGVPFELLAAIAFEETGLISQPQGAESEGNPIQGVMGIRLNDSFGADLAEIAAVSNIPSLLILASEHHNILATGLWLEHRANGKARNWADWVQVGGAFSTEQLGGAAIYQERLATTLLEGIDAKLRDGSAFKLEGIDSTELAAYKLSLKNLIPASPDYSSAAYVPACTGNYTNASRNASDIKRIIIHTVQGSYSSCYNWFANCSAKASAHYVVSKNGAVTQMVLEEDIAWHAGYWAYNESSIGIEHEGFISEPDNYTNAMMEASAALTRSLAEKYNIPLTQVYIEGHYDVPGCPNPGGGGTGCHTDPGPHFDWNKYMTLVTDGDWTPGSGGGDVTPQEATVVGFIREGDIYTGMNLVGASVSLSSGQSTETNGEGYYSITGLNGGSVQVTASLDGYETQTATANLVLGETSWKSMALIPTPAEVVEEEPVEPEEPQPGESPEEEPVVEEVPEEEPAEEVVGGTEPIEPVEEEETPEVVIEEEVAVQEEENAEAIYTLEEEEEESSFFVNVGQGKGGTPVVTDEEAAWNGTATGVSDLGVAEEGTGGCATRTRGDSPMRWVIGLLFLAFLSMLRRKKTDPIPRNRGSDPTERALRSPF